MSGETRIVSTAEKDPLKVLLVNPPIQDPWRTKEDYIEDRESAITAAKISWLSLIVSIVSAAAAVGAVAIAALK